MTKRKTPEKIERGKHKKVRFSPGIRTSAILRQIRRGFEQSDWMNSNEIPSNYDDLLLS